MPTRGRTPLARGVLAFDSPDWTPPAVVVLDTSVVAEALLPNEPEHAACRALFSTLRTHGTTVIFSGLLEIELWEVLFNLALRERHPRKQLRHVRFDGRIRPRAARLLDDGRKSWEALLGTLRWSCVELHEVTDRVVPIIRHYGLQSYDAVHAATLLETGVSDFVTRDVGFAKLPASTTTLHTTSERLRNTRDRRRRVARQPPRRGGGPVIDSYVSR